VNYPSIRIEGAILSPDILEGIEEERGQRPVDFNLDSSAKVKDEIARAWADAQDYWRIFQRKLETLRTDAPATSETRQLWMAPLLGLLGYQLEYQPKGAELNGKIYNISHRATNRAQAPVQIVGYREPSGLDRKPELSNLRMSAHAVVQEFLNLNEYLYGLVTNGRVLRLLRDSSRLIKLSYLEFDLDRIFADALFADFAILYRLLHATRLPVSNDTNAESLIEGYHQKTIEQGTRIREGLREAVTEALEILGTGFLAHPENHSLRQKIESGELNHTTLFSHLLRFIYRILFLNVVEERGLIFPKGTPSAKLKAYFNYYSLQRFRRLARTRGLKTERHHDAWLSLLSTFQIFENPDRASSLGTTAFGGQLFDSASLGPLGTCRLSNAALFESLDRLCSFDDPKTHQRLPVNFGALATEEFGSVYESLLELHPVVETTPSPRFGFKQVAGSERRTSGSYYTPASLVDCLLDSALDPVLDEQVRNHKTLGYPNPEEAILSLKVCDPACGSGHFLIAAAQRIARRLALERAGDEEPSPDILRHALRQVISHCIYAVDINPMSVELCRVALWLEAVEPGKPLSFFDHHIRIGNSLLGAIPELMAAGLPDNAFKPIEGDDKEICSALKKRNKQEREGQRDMLHLMVAEQESEYNSLASRTQGINEAPDDTIDEIQRKTEQFRKLVVSPEYWHAQLVADAWCSAFVWEKRANGSAEPITTDTLRQLEVDPKALTTAQLEEVEHLSNQYQFFHLHLAFPEVFAKGGFDCVLGNPPWERVKLQEKEWFAQRSPKIANAPNAAARKRMIDALKAGNPALHKGFLDDSRKAEGESHMMRNSGRYPLCGRGDINTYAVFAEAAGDLLNQKGRLGFIVPPGIATDDTTKLFFQKIIDSNRLVSLFAFINEARLFPHIDHRNRFCLVTIAGRPDVAQSAIFAFGLLVPADLTRPGKQYRLSAEDIRLINPNSKTCPIFNSSSDAELTKAIYRRMPVLERDADQEGGPWCQKLATMFHMANDSHLFESRERLQAIGLHLSGNAFVGGQERYLPLYEGKMIWQFDHRFGSYDGQTEAQANAGKLPELDPATHADPTQLPQPRYWVHAAEVLSWKDRLCAGRFLIAFREITNSILLRTAVVAVLPLTAVGHKAPLLISGQSADTLTSLIASLNSFPLDYVCRQKIGGVSLSFFIVRQLPFPTPSAFLQPCSWCPTASLKAWVGLRVLELVFTADDLEPFAREYGWSGAPFRWDEERRFLLRCELDAAFFHLYLPANAEGQWIPAHITVGDVRGETPEELEELLRHFPTPRHAVTYIMDTFPIVRRKDEEKYDDHFRTKRVILEIYDAMAKSIRNGQTYQTLLDPPPADPRCCHPARDGTLPTGACRQLSDLMRDHLPQEPFPFQPPSELREALGALSCQCRVLQPTDPLPEQGTWVIIRHPALLKAGTPCGIAVGRFRYQEQINAQTGVPFIHVMLRGGQPPAELNIPEGEWTDFRPLAVFHTE
jgi:Eco57I restriction-modification methylase